jgi:hypothetical protein
MVRGMRLRILYGTLALVVGLAVYAGAAMAIIARLPQNAALAFTAYALAGVLWVGPAAWLTRWMGRAPYRRPPET